MVSGSALGGWGRRAGAGIPGTDLLGLLVEDGRHVQQGAALVQGGRESLPLLLQLAGDLLDLLGGVVARLHQAAGHRHDAVDVHVHVLRRGERGAGQGGAHGVPLRQMQSALSEAAYELKSHILIAPGG